MDDYNHKRPYYSLAKIPPVKYVKLNSFRAKNIENKNNIKNVILENRGVLIKRSLDNYHLNANGFTIDKSN